MRLWAVALMGCLGCDDGAPPVEPDAAQRRIDRLDMAQPDQAVDRGIADAAPDQAPPDAAPPADMRLPDAAPVCDPVGARTCRQEGGEEVFVCAGTSFDIERCEPGTVCRNGECLDPSLGCPIGEWGCLDAGTPARCEPDAERPDLGRWVPQGEACGADAVCSRGGCTTPACAAANETRSYVGCEYWSVDMQAFRYASAGFESVRHAPLGLLVFNPDTEHAVTADVFGPDGDAGALVPEYLMQPPTGDDLPPDVYGPRRLRSDLTAADGTVLVGGIERGEGLSIPPGGRARLLIPRTALFEQTSHLRRQGWRLQTDRPVVAYQFNPLCCNYAFSADASLLIPTHALGQRYRVLTTPTQGGYLGGMVIMATRPDTAVTIDATNKRIIADPDGDVVQRDGIIDALLQPHEALVVQSRNGPIEPSERDLTGALIEASAPVAVFAGHQCAQYPAAVAACDHLEEQLIPVQAWGRTFALTPLLTRGRRGVRQPSEVNYFKLVTDAVPVRIELSVPYADLSPLHGAQPGVTDCVDRLDGPSTISLGAGESCEFGTLAPVQLRASQPILVRGVLSGQRSVTDESAYGARAGDPAAYLIAPDRQFRNDYPFYVPNTYARSAVTITAPADAELTLDGAPLALPDPQPVPGTNAVFGHLELAPGSHRLRARRPFGIVVYGFDDFVGYAFSGGLNLEKE